MKADDDGDGVCNEFEVSGCLDPSADNYVPEATDEVTCLYSGCTNPEADNYEEGTNVDDGSCVVAGCMYSFAANFNPLATYDDGSCYIEATGFCGDGTVWDEASQTCVQEITAYLNDDPDDLAILNPCYFDSDEDGLVNLTDLLNLLTVYGLACP